MAYVPDICWDHAKYELVSEKGEMRHAAFTLYGYYCKRRNKKTGLSFPSLETSSKDTGIPKSNVSMLTTFLRDVGWIDINEDGDIRPLKGFYPEPMIFDLRLARLLLNRISILNIRIGVLLIRTLFKGSLNQPIKPAQLTSSSADSPHGESATESADENFADNLPKSEIGSSATKVDVEPPKAGRISLKQTDERKNHPAIQMVVEISGRWPHKDQWDKIIREIGDSFDTEFFRASWEIWRSFDGKPTNLQGWLFGPNDRGKLPEVFGREAPTPDASPPPARSDAVLSREEWDEILFFCPDCEGIGSIRSEPCSHPRLLEALDQAVTDEKMSRELVERFKKYIGEGN